LKKSPAAPAATIRPANGNTRDKGHFVVSGILGFDTVPGLMKQAMRLFASCDSVVVDFSGVENCNSAGLAVMLEMARQMRQQNKSVCFKSLPKQIYTFARAYSIEKELSQSGLLC
jgi:phospholipid transport system transporter-binding protein